MRFAIWDCRQLSFRVSFYSCASLESTTLEGQPVHKFEFQERKFSKRKIIKNAYLDHAGLMLVFSVEGLDKGAEIVEFLEFWSNDFAKGY